jgi:AcrR family transcriptional regulator
MIVPGRPVRSSPREASERKGEAGKPRSGRRRGKSGSREEIVRAARQLFAERGYAGTTMRAIAQEANVDSALIHHFFGSKKGLFAAAIQDIIQPQEFVTTLMEPGLDHVGNRLLGMFLELWESPDTGEPLLAVLRSVISHQEAAETARELVTSELFRLIASHIDASRPDLRAALVGSQLIGLVMLRLVLRVEPLLTTKADDLVRCVGPVLQHYLTTPGVGDVGGESGPTSEWNDDLASLTSFSQVPPTP